MPPPLFQHRPLLGAVAVVRINVRGARASIYVVHELRNRAEGGTTVSDQAKIQSALALNPRVQQ
jgi:hypothetical protein